MNRFRRHSKSSLKSKSPEESPPSQPSPLSSSHEEELFKRIQEHSKSEENVSWSPKTEAMLSKEAEFGNIVDPAEEAYKTPGQPGGKNSEIPKPTSPSDGKTTQDEEGQPEPVDTPPAEKPEEAKDGQASDAGQDKNGGDAPGKKEEDMDDHTPALVNVIISCMAFVIVAIFLTYFLLKDLVPLTMSNFRQRWDHFRAGFIITPPFMSKLYEEVFEPLKIRLKLPKIFTKNPLNKPEIVITSEH